MMVVMFLVSKARAIVVMDTVAVLITERVVMSMTSVKVPATVIAALVRDIVVKVGFIVFIVCDKQIVILLRIVVVVVVFEIVAAIVVYSFVGEISIQLELSAIVVLAVGEVIVVAVYLVATLLLFHRCQY